MLLDFVDGIYSDKDRERCNYQLFLNNFGVECFIQVRVYKIDTNYIAIGELGNENQMKAVVNIGMAVISPFLLQELNYRVSFVSIIEAFRVWQAMQCVINTVNPGIM